MTEIERLFQIEGDFESSQKECERLENIKNVAGFEKETTQFNFKRKRKKNLQNRINKLEKEIEKGEFDGLIIDRSKPQGELTRKLKFRRMNFKRWWIQRQFQKDGINSLRGVMFCRVMKIWTTPFQNVGAG